MRYRAKTSKIQSDSGVLSDVSKGAVRAANRAIPIFAPFIYLYDYIVGTFAFISRGFLRVKLGSRTFGLFTFLFLVLFTWVGLCYRGVFLQVYSELTNSFPDEGFLADVSIFIMSLFGSFIGMVAFIPDLLSPANDIAPILPQFSIPVLTLLGVTFLLYLSHLNNVKARRKSGEIIHSQYRGDSILFKQLENNIIFGREMTPERIWLIIEPLAVLIIALGIWALTTWHDLAYLLMLSGICLFLEEYKVHKENKELEYNTIDQLLDAKYYDYLQRVVQEKIKASDQKFAQKKYRVSLEEGGPILNMTNRNPSKANFRAKVL